MTIQPARSTSVASTNPHNADAEEAILGSALIDPGEVMPKCRKLLSGSDFFIMRNGWLWDAICALYDRGDQVDILTVSDEMGSKLAEFGGTPAIGLQPFSCSACHYYRQYPVRYHRTYTSRLLNATVFPKINQISSQVLATPFGAAPFDEVISRQDSMGSVD